MKKQNCQTTAIAERRLNTLKKKLEADSELYKKYCDKITEYIQLGQTSLVPERMLAKTDRVWYISHFATGEKFRVVFECAARFSDVSLNDLLLQGPDLTNSLVGVLSRFRK